MVEVIIVSVIELAHTYTIRRLFCGAIILKSLSLLLQISLSKCWNRKWRRSHCAKRSKSKGLPTVVVDLLHMITQRRAKRAVLPMDYPFALGWWHTCSIISIPVKLSAGKCLMTTNSKNFFVAGELAKQRWIKSIRSVEATNESGQWAWDIFSEHVSNYK